MNQSFGWTPGTGSSALGQYAGKKLNVKGRTGDEGVLLLHTERAMDKYFHKFNLGNFNDVIESVESASVIIHKR